MKNFLKLFEKGQKGQVLVIFALTFTMLVAVVGMAIDMGYMYVSYARLRRAVDAATLAGSGEFKRNYNQDRIQAAAKQVLYLNLSGTNTANTDEFSHISFETCDTVAGSRDITDDATLAELILEEEANHPGKEVCTDPLKKIVRGKVRQNVGTFFLSIIGISQFSIEVESLSEAATVDVMLAIDTSESMTWGWNNEITSSSDRDPSQCNIYDSCIPFLDVKNAAKMFIDNLYMPYDRVGIVTFAKDAELILPLNDNAADILAAIEDLKVYEATQTCPYRFEEQNGDRLLYDPIPGDGVNPCRLYHDTESGQGYAAGSYIGFDCPAFFGATPDGSACTTTNTSDGIALAGSILTGDYSSVPSWSYPEPTDGWPEKRNDSLWVLLLLTDGAANSGHDEAGSRICPNAENTYAWFNAHYICRDNNTMARHCWEDKDEAGNRDCMEATFPPGTSSSVDPDLYDAEDRARDMFDVVSRNHTLIFTIGMGSQTPKNTFKYDVNGNAPGEVFLKYGAYGTTYAMKPFSGALKGLYYYGKTASDLTRIFLKIANNLATRINQ